MILPHDQTPPFVETWKTWSAGEDEKRRISVGHSLLSSASVGREVVWPPSFHAAQAQAELLTSVLLQAFTCKSGPVWTMYKYKYVCTCPLDLDPVLGCEVYTSEYIRCIQTLLRQIRMYRATATEIR